MKDNPGYSTGRTAAGDTAVIGNGNGPIGISSTRALRDPGGNGIVKMSSGGCDLELPGLWFSQRIKQQATSLTFQLPRVRASSNKLQASSFKRQAIQRTSHKRQAPSSKLQASSRKLQAPRFENHEKVSRRLNRGAQCR